MLHEQNKEQTNTIRNKKAGAQVKENKNTDIK